MDGRTDMGYTCVSEISVGRRTTWPFHQRIESLLEYVDRSYDIKHYFVATYSLALPIN
jgi:hypothetical protein